MDSDRWQRIQRELEKALDLGDSARHRHLDALDRSAPDIADEVRSLLDADAGRVSNVVAGAFGALEPDSAPTRGAGSDLTVPRPESLGPFQVGPLLGMGGMGAVYLGERAGDDFEQKVALKLIRRAFVSPAAQSRFVNERRILAALQHENIARLVDGGLADDGITPWFAMEYVDGEPLLDALADAPLERRLEVFLAICDAVQYAHRNLVVHRDLKPSNILVDRDGKPKLLDFGIAKVLNDDDGAFEETQDGERPMTPSYAAPEQVSADPVTIATDIYALGVLLYELLTGRHPFADRRGSAAELEEAILHQTPEPPSRGVDETSMIGAKALAGDLDNICLTALRKEPERRYATVAELADDLRRYRDRRPVRATPDSWLYRARKLVQRHRVQSLSIALSLIGLISVSTFYSLRLADERDRAVTEATKSAKLVDFLTELFTAVDPSSAQGQEITARELLRRGVERIDRELQDQPRERADLLHVMGDVHKRLGLYDQSLELFDQALDVDAELGLEQEPRHAASLLAVGEVHLYEERFDEAESFLSRALELRRLARHDQADAKVADADVADALDLLGRLERLRRRPDEAETYHQAALELRQELFTANSLPISESLQSFGLLRLTQNRPDDALEFIRQALDIRLDHLGPEHAETLELQQNLAATLQRTGDPEGSLQVMSEALPGVRKVYGEAHQNVGWTLSSMAYTLQQLGRLDEAVDRDRQAVDVFARRGGGPAGVSPLVQLSRHLTELGELEEAEAAARKALVWLQDSDDKPDPKRSNVLVDLGTILARQGRYDEAAEALYETLRLDLETYGDDHAYVAQDRYKLGDLLRTMGRSTEALEWLDLALKRQRRFKPGAAALALSLSSRGFTLLDLNRPGEAEQSFGEALDVFAVHTPSSHPDVAEALLGQGLSLAALGQAEDGRRLVSEAGDRLAESLGEDHGRTLAARERLRELKARPATTR